MEVVVHCPYLEALVVGLHLLLAEMVHFAVLVVPDSTVVVEELDELWLIKVVEQQIFSACLVVFDFAVRGRLILLLLWWILLLLRWWHWKRPIT